MIDSNIELESEETNPKPSTEIEKTNKHIHDADFYGQRHTVCSPRNIE